MTYWFLIAKAQRLATYNANVHFLWEIYSCILKYSRNLSRGQFRTLNINTEQFTYIPEATTQPIGEDSIMGTVGPPRSP